MDALAIVRMQNGQPFRECRNAFRWIETEENERLRRPIIECSIRLQRPASHVCESLSLSQVNSLCSRSVSGPCGRSDRVLRVSRFTFPTFLLRRFEIVDARTIGGQPQLS